MNEFDLYFRAIPKAIEKDGKANTPDIFSHADGNGIGGLFTSIGMWPFGIAFRKDFTVKENRPTKLHPEFMFTFALKPLAVSDVFTPEGITVKRDAPGTSYVVNLFGA